MGKYEVTVTFQVDPQDPDKDGGRTLFVGGRTSTQVVIELEATDDQDAISTASYRAPKAVHDQLGMAE